MTTLRFSLLALLSFSSLTGCARWTEHATLDEAHMRMAPVAQHIEGAQGVAYGTPVRVVLTSSIHSENDSAEGASFVVMQDVHAVDGSVVLPAGSPVAVRIREHRRRRLGRPAEIIVQTVGALAPDGTLVPLRGEARVAGTPRRGLAAGMTIGMAFVYWPVAALHLLHRGGAAEMQSGYVIQTTVGI